MNESNDLEAYRANVERLAELGSSEIFSNSRPAHAVIILETFFKYAKERVVVFCQKLSTRTYGGRKLIDQVEKALRRGVNVNVVIQENPESQDFVGAANRWKAQGLPISVSKAKVIDPPAEVNFAVMDQKAYRFEQDRDTPEAFACMNDPKSAALLAHRFSQFEQESTCILSAEGVAEACQPQPA